MLAALFSLILLVLWIYALVQILGSGASSGTKVVWILVVILLPFLGVVLWFLMGPKAAR